MPRPARLRRLRSGLLRGCGLLGPLVLVVLAATVARPAAAQETPGFLITTVSSRQLLDAGRAQLLAFDLDAARGTFRRLATRPDGRAGGRYHLLQGAFYEALFTEDPAVRAAWHAEADTLASVLKDLPPGPWRAYLAAERDGQAAVMAAAEGHAVRAAWAGRAAYRGYRALLEEDPAFEDAYKGLGLVQLLVGTLPSVHRRLLRWAGLPGEVTAGMAGLERAAIRGTYAREEARAYHAFLGSAFSVPGHAPLPALATLYAAHPRSPAFAYLYGYVLLAHRRAEEAAGVLGHAARPAHATPIPLAAFYRAEALLRLGRYAEAEAAYRHYLARRRSPALGASAWLGLGLSLELQGRRAEALPAYAAAQAAADGQDSETAAEAARQARQRHAAPLDGPARTLLQAQHAYASGRYERAEALLKALREGPLAPEARFLLGRAYHAAGRLAEAEAAYREAAEQPPPARHIPWAWYHLGEVLAAQGRPDAATAAFRAALAYDGPTERPASLEAGVRAALAATPR